MAERKQVERLTKDLIDQSLLIEAEFLSLRMATLPENVSEVLLQAMRQAFFAGAQHVFGSIMTAISPGEDVTPEDVRIIGLVSEELDRFGDQFLADLPTAGRA